MQDLGTCGRTDPCDSLVAHTVMAFHIISVREQERGRSVNGRCLCGMSDLPTKLSFAPMCT